MQLTKTTLALINLKITIWCSITVFVGAKEWPKDHRCCLCNLNEVNH